jgi:hypothetical protein
MMDSSKANQTAIDKEANYKKKDYYICQRLTNQNTKIGLARSSLMRLSF